ncbi:MAG: hypothetical protein IID37_09260, partial [Planctomycetes bacterium]|nr:hypothetical protein [Planctomycetota bacterium]
PICSHDVINDTCADAPIGTLYTSDSPLTYKGDNTYATMTCVALGFEETWHAVDLDSDFGMTTSLCGTYPPFGNAFIVIDQSCPCSGNFIFANLFDQTTCDDGNWAMHYDSLPSGVYFTPVLKDDTSTGPYTWNISPFGSPPPQACGPGTGNCCQEGGNGSPSCDDEDCCNAICAADPFCCDTEWDDICADQAQDECDICNFVCKFDENCDDDDVCTDDICNEAGQCVNPDNGTCQCGGSEAGDCCEEGGNGGPFCNDFICCNMVCDNDSFCCETQWDDLCADQACELCDICRCSE